MLENLDGTCIFYLPQEQEAFVKGRLREQWLKLYPALLDGDDFRITLKQRKNHFNEWLGAIHLFRTYGLLSLVEKYQFKNHPHQQVVLRRVLPDSVWEFISGLDFRQHGQCPDLFVYDPQCTDYIFVEMKSLNEPLTKKQEVLFPRLAEISGKRVLIMRTQKLATHSLEGRTATD